MEAVKQGSAAVGVVGRTHTVLAGIKRCVDAHSVCLLSSGGDTTALTLPSLPPPCTCRCPSELAYHVQKVFRIDDHMGIAISGLTADARSLCKYVGLQAERMRTVIFLPLVYVRHAVRVIPALHTSSRATWLAGTCVMKR